MTIYNGRTLKTTFRHVRCLPLLYVCPLPTCGLIGTPIALPQLENRRSPPAYSIPSVSWTSSFTSQLRPNDLSPQPLLQGQRSDSHQMTHQMNPQRRHSGGTYNTAPGVASAAGTGQTAEEVATHEQLHRQVISHTSDVFLTRLGLPNVRNETIAPNIGPYQPSPPPSAYERHVAPTHGQRNPPLSYPYGNVSDVSETQQWSSLTRDPLNPSSYHPSAAYYGETPPTAAGAAGYSPSIGAPGRRPWPQPIDHFTEGLASQLR